MSFHAFRALDDLALQREQWLPVIRGHGLGEHRLPRSLEEAIAGQEGGTEKEAAAARVLYLLLAIRKQRRDHRRERKLLEEKQR